MRAVFRILMVVGVTLTGWAFNGSVTAADLRALPDGAFPDDARLSSLKDLNGYFPFDPPETETEWQQRSSALRRRVLVSTGLWPFPARTPLNAQIYGKTTRPGFTVEKVHFESVPGHFVTGLLFRPDRGDGPFPGVLCPHGHGGRLQDLGEKGVRTQIERGQERFEKSGRYPKLARCAQLARMGCVVFIFDMLGYADSVQISSQLAHRFAKQRPELDAPDRWGFYSTQAELRMQSILGLQVWNNVRALDFLEGLPDVDGKRLAVTGGSGGGTQTILVGAVDSRPVAAFPQGMVSTAMQGGCTCENACLLRIGTGNVELAGLWAPRPMAMTGANDWTKEIATKGYPQLRQLYQVLGQPDNVYSISFLEFPHNYNYVTRQVMYEWMNRHLGLGHESIEEQDYEPLTAEEYTVWDAAHPQPEGGVEYEVALLKQLDQAAQKQLDEVAPHDAAGLQKFREVVGGAFETILNPLDFDNDQVGRVKKVKQDHGGYLLFADLLRNEANDAEIPVMSVYPKSPDWNGKVVIWIDGSGKQALLDNEGRLIPAVHSLVLSGYSIVSADLLNMGEFLNPGQLPGAARVVSNPREFAGYTFCYNDTLMTHRVHDVQTLIKWVDSDEHSPQEISLVGVNGAAPIVAAAAAVSSEIDRVAIDTRGFRFQNLKSYRDPMFIPGAVKYGDLPGLLALLAPRPLALTGETAATTEITAAAFRSSQAADQLDYVDASKAGSLAALAQWLQNQ